MHETGRKGDIGVAAVTADLLSQGLEVLTPVSSCSPFDLVATDGSAFYKVQVKYAAKKNGCVEAMLGRAVITNSGVRRRLFQGGEVDVVAVYCPDTRACYYVKASEVNGWARFRLDPPKNRYATRIRMAAGCIIFPK